MKIAIDIGHADGTGAQGNGYEEHALCSVLGSHLQALLNKAGHSVNIFDYPDQTNGEDLASTARAINAWGADLSVSLHADASDNRRASGAHVCFISDKGKELALSIARPLTHLLPGRADAIKQRTDLYILKATRMPAVLVECGFITNWVDSKILADQPEKIAQRIAEGVINYLDEIPW